VKSRLGEAIQTRKALDRGFHELYQYYYGPNQFYCRRKEHDSWTPVVMASSTVRTRQHFRFSNLPTEIKEIVFFMLLPEAGESTAACAQNPMGFGRRTWHSGWSRVDRLSEQWRLWQSSQLGLAAITATCREWRDLSSSILKRFHVVLYKEYEELFAMYKRYHEQRLGRLSGDGWRGDITQAREAYMIMFTRAREIEQRQKFVEVVSKLLTGK
jgi:hypothetical protein